MGKVTLNYQAYLPSLRYIPCPQRKRFQTFFDHHRRRRVKSTMQG
jgi:hypothetical protein